MKYLRQPGALQVAVWNQTFGRIWQTADCCSFVISCLGLQTEGSCQGLQTEGNCQELQTEGNCQGLQTERSCQGLHTEGNCQGLQIEGSRQGVTDWRGLSGVADCFVLLHLHFCILSFFIGLDLKTVTKPRSWLLVTGFQLHYMSRSSLF